jgi:hypothetical protein
MAALLAAMAFVTVPAQARFRQPNAEYEGRRAKLQAMADGPIVIFGYTGQEDASEGRPLGQYFIHGVSHHLGLNVHDPSDRKKPLEAGMVITVEPGIYIPEENLGGSHRG